MRVLAMLDGSVGDPDQPLIKVEDLGLMRGDGVFETILVVDGRPRELDPHLDRLARSAAMLDMPAPDAEGWRRAVRTVLDNWTGDADFALKLVYTRGVEGADEPTAFALGMEIGEKVRRQR
jgi:4-amino-4-deoxychorismate lyase